jgi:hypothetical protein
VPGLPHASVQLRFGFRPSRTAIAASMTEERERGRTEYWQRFTNPMRKLEKCPMITHWTYVTSYHGSATRSSSGVTEQSNRRALRPSAGGMVSLNIMCEIAHLIAIPQWTAEDRLAVSLVKDDALNVLLMVLKKGARLAKHPTGGPIAARALSGSVRFSAGSERTELSSGSMAALDLDIADPRLR